MFTHIEGAVCSYNWLSQTNLTHPSQKCMHAQVKPSCTYLQDTCKKSKKRARSMPSCKNTVLQDLQ